MSRLVFLTCALLPLSGQVARAADGDVNQSIMRAAAYVIASSMQINAQLVVDSMERAHTSAPAATFMKINECVYAGRSPSLDGDRFLIVNFNKMTTSYGRASGDFEYSGDFNANCWGVGSTKWCSGALHIPFSANELMVFSAMSFIKRHGC